MLKIIVRTYERKLMKLIRNHLYFYSKNKDRKVLLVFQFLNRNFSSSHKSKISLYNFVIYISEIILSVEIVCKLAWYLTRVRISFNIYHQKEITHEDIWTVYIGATGKKLWKLVRQANSTGKVVARIRNDPYKYVYAFRRIFLHVC